jgi:hypothetical protein
MGVTMLRSHSPVWAEIPARFRDKSPFFLQSLDVVFLMCICANCICLVCIVVILCVFVRNVFVLRVLLSFYVYLCELYLSCIYCCHLMFICCTLSVFVRTVFVLRVLLSSYVYLCELYLSCVYCCHLMCICCTLCVFVVLCIAAPTVDAGLLARSQYPEGSATGHLDTGFSSFPCVYKRMLRQFPSFQVATTCLSCSPPDLNFLVTFYSHLCECKITTATGR